MPHATTWARAQRRTGRATVRAIRRRRPLPMTVLAGRSDRVELAVAAPFDEDFPDRLGDSALVAAAFAPARARLVLPDLTGGARGAALLCVEAERVADGLLEAQWTLPARPTPVGVGWGPPRRADPTTPAVSTLARAAAACVDPRDGGDADAQRLTVLAAADAGHQVRLAPAAARRCGLEGVLPHP